MNKSVNMYPRDRWLKNH